MTSLITTELNAYHVSSTAWSAVIDEAFPDFAVVGQVGIHVINYEMSPRLTFYA